MTLLTVKPQFLYPRSRQFPFDEIAENIVRALEKRNWNVPGIEVEFDTYGSGETKYKYVKRITGKDFILYFMRIQGRVSKKMNDIAALQSVCIPKQILEVFEDESDPGYYLYVGDDWKKDKKWFMNSTKVNSKLRKEPRRYLCYRGNTYKRRAEVLLPDSDLDREYLPEGDEPRSIVLEEKFNEIIIWLREFVLEYILSLEETEKVVEPMQTVEIIPYKGPWKTIFSICDLDDAKRIEIGKNHPEKLPPEKRHAYIGKGTRLVPLDVRLDEGLSQKAYEGFIWCDVNQNASNLDFVRDVERAMKSLFDDTYYLVAINLKYANEVYVVDNSKYYKKRNEMFEMIAPRDVLTDDELGRAYASRGETLVSISEYKGEYHEPIVQISRELELEEIEWMVKVTE